MSQRSESEEKSKESSGDRRGQGPRYRIRDEAQTEACTGVGLWEACSGISSSSGVRTGLERVRCPWAVNGPEF